MRAFILSVFHFSFVILLLLARPAAAEFADAEGFWKLLGQQNSVPRYINMRGTPEFPILEVVGDCGEGLCSWGATRADLLYDADGDVVRWQAFMEVNEDFHEFDAYLINGEVLIDYIGELASTDEMISATLIFARMSEAEVVALSSGAPVGDGAAADPGGPAADSGDELAEAGDPEDDPVVADPGAADGGGGGASLEEQIVTGGLVLGGLLLLNALLNNDGNAPAADPDDSCGKTPVLPYMGKKYFVIPSDLIEPGDRVHPQSAMVTMDLIPSRLNIVYRDDNKRVVKIGCY
ncbi:MAG: hypothetical protein CMM68_09545 [Rhodospirillaceae bacterium]|nr:hypothetical protein [Rhodospirillaceae bacterium]